MGIRGKSLLHSTQEAVRSRLGRPRPYRVGNVQIKLTPGHRLPGYQRRHILYDRFLPHLAQHLATGIVVDIGANCGDTLAGMVGANPNLEYICVEADDEFLQILHSNAETIRKERGARVRVLTAFVGKDVGPAALLGSGGTKSARPQTDKDRSRKDCDDAHLPVTLDLLLARENINLERIELIKSDVDGYDYDVIASARGTLERIQPLLFFECDFRSRTAMNAYLNTFDMLAQIGYNDYWFFDNFGAPMVRVQHLGQIRELLEYALRQLDERSTRTLYYFDVLAVPPKTLGLVEAVVAKYGNSATSTERG